VRRAARQSALAAAAAIALLAAARPAAAHDFNPGVLTLVELEDGRFRMAWTPPVDSTGSPAGVEVVLPEPCRRAGDLVDCGEAGLAGTISFARVHTRRMKVVVLVRWLGGEESEAIVSGADPRLRIDRRAAGPRAVGAWIALGVEHILLGLDHLAFVIGLLLLLGPRPSRRLLATITAFTVAHSITLALAALDLVRLPSAPVEAAIAASVVLVAREALGRRPTATRRWPWLVAGLFGLVHGLGFAGALAEIGLPRESIGVSLVGFNLGVELGQLAVVAAVVLLVGLAGALARRTGAGGGERARLAARAAAYALGSIGAAWFLARVLA